MIGRSLKTLATICCLVGLAACTSSGDSAESTLPTATTIESAPSTTSDSALTLPAETTPPTETPIASTVAPTTGGPTTVAPTTVAATTNPSEAVPVAVLDVDTASVFGVPVFAERASDDVVRIASDRLGTPTSDTGFVQVEAGRCFANSAARTVRWGDLRMTFLQLTAEPENNADSAVGTETLLAWAVGSSDAEQLAPTDEDPVDPRATGLTTMGGIGVGSTRDDVRAAFPEDRTLGFDGDRITVLGEDGANPTGFALVGDTVVGIGTGPLDCAPPDEER